MSFYDTPLIVNGTDYSKQNADLSSIFHDPYIVSLHSSWRHGPQWHGATHRSHGVSVKTISAEWKRASPVSLSLHWRGARVVCCCFFKRAVSNLCCAAVGVTQIWFVQFTAAEKTKEVWRNWLRYGRNEFLNETDMWVCNLNLNDFCWAAWAQQLSKFVDKTTIHNINVLAILNNIAMIY